MSDYFCFINFILLTMNHIMYDTSKMEIDIERAIVALLFTQK